MNTCTSKCKDRYSEKCLYVQSNLNNHTSSVIERLFRPITGFSISGRRIFDIRSGYQIFRNKDDRHLFDIRTQICPDIEIVGYRI
jgi:hypothetical protein